MRASSLVLLLLALPLGLPAQGSSPAPQLSSSPAPSYVPHRVYDTRRKHFIDFETLANRLGEADLVFFGEQHDDPATHRMELALLEGLARRRDSVVLALEMFERDVQPLLDGYLRGDSSETALLAGGRPWKNYAADYRPLVELAKSRGWPVIASNVPRPVASAVARQGAAALDSLAASRRADAAASLHCPEDEYYDRFAKVMGDLSQHGPAPGGGSEDSPKARLGRMYQAQCLKDETMGESVARVFRPGWLVVHYNGAFHSDFGLGTAERARERTPHAKVVVVTALPVKELDRLEPSKEDRKRANYLIYVLAAPPSATADSTRR